MNLSLSAFAFDDCATASLDLKKMPRVGDQGGTAWCSAFAAADILSYEVGFPVSVPDLRVSSALAYYNFLEDHIKSPPNVSDYPDRLKKELLPKMMEENLTYESQSLSGVLEHGIDYGVCRDSDFPMHGYNKKKFGITYSTSLQEDLDVSIVILSLEVAKKRLETLGDPNLACQNFDALKELRPDLSQNDFLASLIDAKLPATSVVRALSLMCKGKRKKVEKFKIETKVSEGPAMPNHTRHSELKDFIEGTIAENKVLGVALDENFSSILSGRKENFGHAMSLVGKKRIDRGCFYHVRNSWGSGENLDELCARLKVKDKKEVLCDPKMPGYLWIERDFLINTLMGATRIGN